MEGSCHPLELTRLQVLRITGQEFLEWPVKATRPFVSDTPRSLHVCYKSGQIRQGAAPRGHDRHEVVHWEDL